MRRSVVNGEPTDQIQIMDRGLQYGDGLFETLRVQDGQIPLWPYHWQRLLSGCERLGIPRPDQDVLIHEMNALVSTTEQATLKLILTRGTGVRGYAVPEPTHPSRILILSDRPDYPQAYWQTGIRVFPCKTRLGINPLLAGIKHLNRLEQVLGRNEWQGQEYQEGLLQDIEGHIIEGTISNVFWLKDGQVYTPDLSRCGVEGVMRKIVIELARDHSMLIKVGSWSKSELLDAEEIFISNSLIGLWPVNYIFNKTFPVGPVTQQLQSLLQAKYAL